MSDMSDDDLRERYRHIPPLTFAALLRHREQSQPYPHGDFLTAILTNDLRAAFRHADAHCLEAMPEILRFVYHELPAQSHGSRRRLDAWISCAAAKES